MGMHAGSHVFTWDGYTARQGETPLCLVKFCKSDTCSRRYRVRSMSPRSPSALILAMGANLTRLIAVLVGGPPARENVKATGQQAAVSQRDGAC